METRQVPMETMSNTSYINSCFPINKYTFVLSRQKPAVKYVVG